MFWILGNSIENEIEDAILEGHISLLDDFDISFEEGVPIPEKLFEDSLILEVDENALRGRMTDQLCLDDISCSAFSRKSKELFSLLGIHNLQYFPLDIIDNYTNAEEVELAKLRDEKLDYISKVYEDYYISNVTTLLDCVDHEMSDLDYFVSRPDIPEDMPEEMKAALEQEEDNDIDFIRKLVLDDSKIPDDIKIFRLKDCPRILVFKEEIVQAIREEGLTGFVFVPLSEYTDEIPDDDDDDEMPKDGAADQEKTTENKTVTETPEPPIAETNEPSPSRKSITIKRIKRN